MAKNLKVVGSAIVKDLLIIDIANTLSSFQLILEYESITPTDKEELKSLIKNIEELMK